MLLTARDFIPNQDIQVLPLGTSIREALKLMVGKVFSQIPVVDSDGVYVGLLSEHGIAEHLERANHHRDALSEVIDRWYDDKTEPARPDIDVGQILTRLKTQDAVVIVDSLHKPKGVVTHYDVAQKCGDYAHRFMLIEYIESTLREYFEVVYLTPEARDRALAKAASAETERDHSTDKRPEKYEDSTLRTIIETMKSQWGKFKPYFGPLESFNGALQDVSDIRNIVMHFRREEWNDDLLHTLEQAARYLRRCQQRFPPTKPRTSNDYATASPISEGAEQQQGARVTTIDGFDLTALGDLLWSITDTHLAAEPDNADIEPITLTFAEVRDALDMRLPPEAFSQAEWWTGGRFRRVGSAGDTYGLFWYTCDVNLSKQTVSFDTDSD